MEMERQNDYTIAEDFTLPSGGKIYDVTVNPNVRLRSMTGREELRRQNPSSLPLKTLADLIEGCMLEKPAVPVYDMAIGDYEFLLHKLRVVTYGDSYKLAVMCPSCGAMAEATAHLNDLEVKEFDLDTFNSLREITLPRTKKIVKLNFQTPRMLDTTEQRAKELKKKLKSTDINLDVLVLLTAVVDSVDGVTLNQVEKEAFINRLPAMDMQKIINSIDTLNSYIGIDNKITVDCPKCGGEVKTFFRLGQEFFRPSDI